MIYLIKGTPDSGKSKRAEELATTLAKGDKYYVATMIPYGEEGAKRVERHRKMREGKGFITIEEPYDILNALRRVMNPERATLLIECMANLAANLYFEKKLEKEAVAAKALEQIEFAASLVPELVVVTNEFDGRNPSYNEETLIYIDIMRAINKGLEKIASRVEVMGESPE